ncbi:GntR family transcriptional regulator [Sphingomonas sp. QA11]|uniref:GntR family transcriptional regulator n=1 Tax=Sphingomonas sp. QA11 TaxID=2950605 RepID=UPI002349B6D6|nr:GntR family transcriptional regulator [Sphingomonas sp. QA11]WCM26663.1 GntR family transcriptional regulator [Sphingomonas sp. QA11]
MVPVPTLVAWAHEHLPSTLVTMEIAPGTWIGFDAVARKLGISRTPIREALGRFEAEKPV